MGKTKKFSTLAFILIVIITSSITTLLEQMAIAAKPGEPHNADAMWIEPSLINATGLSIGYKFNITVWINVSVACGAWQFHLIYPKAYINATRCGYTAGAKSDFFKNVPTTVPVDLVFGVQNTTHNYIEHAESWLGGTPAGPGYGSLSWIEFEITALPPDGVIVCSLDISSSYPSDTFAVNFDTSGKIPLNVSDSLIIPEFTPLLILAILSTITVIAVFASKVLRPKLDKTSIKK